GRAPSKLENRSRDSICDRWLVIEPRARLLELRGQSKQRRLVAVARDKLNRDRESSRGRGVGSRQRQDDRRLAGQVEAHRERREVEDAAPVFMRHEERTRTPNLTSAGSAHKSANWRGRPRRFPASLRGTPRRRIEITTWSSSKVMRWAGR